MTHSEGQDNFGELVLSFDVRVGFLHSLLILASVLTPWAFLPTQAIAFHLVILLVSVSSFSFYVFLRWGLYIALANLELTV